MRLLFFVPNFKKEGDITGELRTKKRGKSWEYSFECARVDGKRKSISKGGFRTKAEALAAGTKAKAEYDNAGVVFRPSEMSLSDYLDFWLKSFVKTNCTDNTYDSYASAIRIHIKPALGHYKLSSLTPAAIQQWVDSLKNEKGLSAQSIANFRGVLSGALKYAIYPCEYLKTNPCSLTRPPKVPVDPRGKMRIEHICIGQEWEDIKGHFSGTYYYLPLMICYFTGLRIGECFGLDLARDVDFSRHTITVARQLQQDLDHKWYYKNPKYDSFRTIKIGNTLESLIKSEITARKMNKLRYGEYYTKTYVDQNNYLHWLPADQTPPAEYMEVWPLVKENGEMLNNRNLAAHGGRVYNYIPNATVKLQHPDTLLPLAEDIHELIETQGLPLLLNTLSLLSYKEPFEIIDRTLHEELNRHLTLYEKDVDILGETLNLTLYKDQPNCTIIDGKEYPFISRIQSGLPGVKLIDAPDDLIDLLSNRLSDNTDN